MCKHSNYFMSTVHLLQISPWLSRAVLLWTLIHHHTTLKHRSCWYWKEIINERLMTYDKVSFLGFPSDQICVFLVRIVWQSIPWVIHLYSVTSWEPSLDTEDKDRELLRQLSFHKTFLIMRVPCIYILCLNSQTIMSQLYPVVNQLVFGQSYQAKVGEWGVGVR